MRQTKALLKAKKPMRNCGDCKCVTLQAWRCMDELCNCGDWWSQPTPDVPVTSIWEPSANSLEIIEGRIDTSITFSYSPADATNVFRDVTVSSADESVAKTMIDSAENWTAVLYVIWEGVWDTELTITTGDITYHVDVTVTPAP